MPILKAGLLYFALVFASGFVLEAFRELSAVPRFGQMTAELMEMPIMLAAVVCAVRWTVRRCRVSPAPLRRLGMGLVALGLLAFMELTVVLSLRSLSVSEYLKSRDPLPGAVYLVMLGAFPIMPLFVARR